ncbi:cysteine-rich with EGF-like domain protein 2 isoform X2 [Styela clava]
MVKSIILISLLLVFTICDAEETKSKCDGCRDLSRGILDGLDKTKKKNFEGGDVAWEEKKLGKYKTSETRLVEILDTYACSKSNHRCNTILEEKEEKIEFWYKNLQDEKPLFDYLCVEEAQVCCPDDTFGADCEDCPKGTSDKVCFGRGKCEGAGDREGSGKCVCDDGYSGEFCSDCGDQHFETFRNDTYTMCALCHNSCKTCKGNKSTECSTCMDGYRSEENIDNEDELKCVDINECVEQANLCPVGTYCANNEGSYSCEACNPACSSCFGPSYRHCHSCKQGMIMNYPYLCQDIDECASGAICLGMYEVCVNTLGHYKCACARYFRRDPVSGQCQPDPNIYSRMVPPSAPSKAADKGKAEKADEGEIVVGNEVEDSLSDDDIKRLVVAVVICIIGTAAAGGNLIWTALFFCSIIGAGVWWASDKTDELAMSMIPQPHQEL